MRWFLLVLAVLATGCPKKKTTCSGETPDPGCSDEYPHRVWPVAADVTSCTSPPHKPTGPDSANWFGWAGCGVRRDFPAEVGKRVLIRADTDGCGCPSCALWHLNFQVQENKGFGFVRTESVSMPDNLGCPNASTEVVYVPGTTTMRLAAQPGDQGTGFYFAVCSE